MKKIIDKYCITFIEKDIDFYLNKIEITGNSITKNKTIRSKIIF